MDNTTFGEENDLFGRNTQGGTNGCLNLILKGRNVDTDALVLRDITNNLFVEVDDNDDDRKNCRKQNDVARERWDILAKALLKKQTNPSGRPDDKPLNISVRRFKTFQLIKSTQTENNLDSSSGRWLEYSTEIAGKTYRIDVHHLEPRLTAKELAGFNNTGNICVWPSEEVLAYYLLSNLDVFRGKRVVEIGGGMTCLAGVFLAAYGNVTRIDLTDGNVKSVDNIDRIIKRNELDGTRVRAVQLDWVDRGRPMDHPYDVVLSSDCLFFDETRAHLVETIWEYLKEDGTALVMAPKRGNTLNSFVKMARARGFECVVKNHYDETVWRKHVTFKESNVEYDENLHYPVLLLLNKFARDNVLHQGNVFNPPIGPRI